MSFTSITVTFTYKKTDGTAAAGTVTFSPVDDYTDDVTIETDAQQVITLDVNGAGSVVVPVVGASTAFYVIERIIGSSQHSYAITVLANAPGGTVALGSLRS